MVQRVNGPVRFRGLMPYVLPVVGSSLVLLAVVLIGPNDLPPSLPFVAVATVSTWYGGLRAGLLATFLGTLVDLYVYLSPLSSAAFGTGDGTRILLFVLTAFLVSWLAGSLRHTQRKLQATIAAAPLAIITGDASGRITSWNPAAERMLGWTQAEVVGKPSAIVPQEKQEEHHALMSRITQGELLQDVEVRRQTKDGSWIDLNISSASISDHRGQFAEALVVFADVTERKRADEKLRESEERYRELFESAHDGIFTLDLAQNFTSINRAGERISGYTQDEILQMNVGQIVAPEYRDLMHQMFQQKLGDHQATTYELEIVTRDGRRVPVETTTQLICRNGVSVGVQGIARDITERNQAAAMLRSSVEFNHAVITNAREGIVVYDRQLRYRVWNPYMEQLTGLTAKEVIGKYALDLFPHLGEQGIDDLLHRAVAGETSRSGDIPFHTLSTGKMGWATGSYAPQRDAHGEIIGVIGVITDVTERKQAEKVLKAQTETLREQADLLDLAYDAIFVRDLNGSRIEFWNRGAEMMYGWCKDEALGQISYQLLHTQFPQPLEAIEAEVKGTGRWEGELVHARRDGTHVVVGSRWALQCNDRGEPSGILEINSDITQRRQFEEDLRHQALHDSLTGLPNHTLLQNRLHEGILDAQKDTGPVALLLLDLDRFKEINYALGHSYGDVLLQKISLRLRQAIRQSDTIARLGGDKFALVLPGVDGRTALKVAAKLHRSLAAPFADNEHNLQLEASIGIAVYPKHGIDAVTLLRHADIAMYAAKRDKSLSVVYHPDQDQHGPDQLALMGELRRAIEQDELALHYQPQARMQTGCAEHVEALVRWQHPQRGFIPPDEFIPLAEQTGLIEPLTRWVLKKALRQCKLWHDAGLDIRVAVNLSARNLQRPRLVQQLAGLLQSREILPDWLELEITESAVMSDPGRALHTLNQLHEMGIRISIDDFGTGYSSLGYLKRLPVDAIKIDKSFVLEMLHDDSAATIVRSTIRLGHELGLQVVAEGVEDQAIWEVLAEMDCDLGQGYYVSRPIPPDECTAWLTRQPCSPDSDSCESERIAVQGGVIRPFQPRRRSPAKKR